MILKKNYLFLSVLFAVAFSLAACSKGTRLLVVEGINTPNPQLFITNSKGDKNKTNITPSLPDGYTFDGRASFLNTNKQRIRVTGRKPNPAFIAEGNTANSTQAQFQFQFFTCNLRGKDIVKIEETSIPQGGELNDHR